jgi:hypothetical protein
MDRFLNTDLLNPLYDVRAAAGYEASEKVAAKVSREEYNDSRPIGGATDLCIKQGQLCKGKHPAHDG